MRTTSRRIPRFTPRRWRQPGCGRSGRTAAPARAQRRQVALAWLLARGPSIVRIFARALDVEETSARRSEPSVRTWRYRGALGRDRSPATAAARFLKVTNARDRCPLCQGDVHRVSTRRPIYAESRHRFTTKRSRLDRTLLSARAVAGIALGIFTGSRRRSCSALDASYPRLEPPRSVQRPERLERTRGLIGSYGAKTRGRLAPKAYLGGSQVGLIIARLARKLPSMAALTEC